MDPFIDYIPDPPNLDVIEDWINRLNNTIEAFRRLERQGRVAGLVAIEYLSGIRRDWEAIRRGEVRNYQNRLPENLEGLIEMRDSLQDSVNQAVQENEEILNAIARDLENGVDAPIVHGCDEQDIGILRERIARVQGAIDFLNANL